MRVALVADVRVYREALAAVLAREAVTVVATASRTGATDLPAAASEVDVLVVDATDPAFDFVEEMAARLSETPIVALAAPESEPAVVRLAEAGVSAFVPADGSAAELAAAVRSVASGESLLSPRVAATLLARVRGLTRERYGADTPLTRREVEVTRLIDQGLSNKEIAGRLSIAVPTVKNHVHHILEKLGVEHRDEAAAKVWGAHRST